MAKKQAKKKAAKKTVKKVTAVKNPVMSAHDKAVFARSKAIKNTVKYKKALRKQHA